MVLAYHVVISYYGFWLPNDPRGSNSIYVRAPWLLKYGPATTVAHRRSVAWKPHDRNLRREAKRSLRYDPVVVSGRQARAIVRGFALACEKCGFVVYACAVMPTHVHLVIGRHSYIVENVVNQLKGAATRQLRAEGIHPFEKHVGKDGSVPCVWADGMRKVFLNTPDEIRGRIEYVNDNPAEAGLKPQTWSFVQPYPG
jgi:REP element-mobilizing transposase RayT